MKAVDIALKDLLRSFRSLFAVGMMLVAPMLITGLIHFAFSGTGGEGSVELPPLRVLLVNHDSLKMGKMLQDYLEDPEMPEWLQVEGSSEAEARQAVTRGEAGAAVILPQGFSKAIFADRDEPARLVIVQDPTLTLGPQIVQGLLQIYTDSLIGVKIAMQLAQDELAANDGQVSPQAMVAFAQNYGDWLSWAGRSLNSDHSFLSIVAPGDQAPAGSDENQTDMARILARVMVGMLIFFVFFTGANSAQSILHEEEEGTLARLFTTPTSRTAILAGKFLAVVFTTGVQSIVLLLLSAMVFGISWGRPASLVFMIAALVLASSGFGICLMSLIKNLRQSGPVIGGVLTTTGMLGGLMTTGIAMPKAFEIVNLTVPQGWALRGLKLVLDGGSLLDVLPSFLVLMAMGGVLFWVGALAFKRRFA